MDKRSNEASAGGIHVDRNINTLLFFQIVQRLRDLPHRLIMQRMRHPKRRNHPNRIVVASTHRLLWRQVKPMSFTRHLSEFDVEVSRKLVPAHLDGSANYIWMHRRLPFPFAASPPSRNHPQPAE